MKDSWQERFLYLLLAGILIILLIDACGGFFNLAWAQHAVFDLLKIVLPLVLLVTHSIYSLSLKRSLCFILLLCLGGLAAEVIGLKTGWLFGGFYRYSPESRMIFSEIALFHRSFYLWGVPLPVIIYWAVFIYAAYSISNSFIFWQGMEKPSRENKNIALLGKLVALDVFTVLAIDLILDPVLVHTGNWQWERPGVYFGIPLGNFTGWMIVTACLTGVFRCFEYKFPLNLERKNRLIILFPVLCLSALFILGVGVAWYAGLYLLIPVACLTLAPVIAINLYFFFRKML